jgi:HK97 gp10 family phage protein
VKIEGLKELEAKLKALGAKDGSRAIRTAVLAAGRVILLRARANVQALQRGSGAYALSLGVRYARGGSEDVPVGRRFVAQVGPRATDRRALALYNTAYGRRARGIFYGHLIERGFRRGSTQVPGRPVLRSAIEQTRSQAVEKFRVTLGRAITRITKRRQRSA